MKFKNSSTVQKKFDVLSRRLKIAYFVFVTILLAQTGLFFGTRIFADLAEIDKSNPLIRSDGNQSIIVGNLGANFSYFKSGKPFGEYKFIDKDKQVTQQFNLLEKAGKTTK